MADLGDLQPFVNAAIKALAASHTPGQFGCEFREALAKQETSSKDALLPSRPSKSSELQRFEIRAPFPEEILQGWLGRIRLLNGLKQSRVEVALRAMALQKALALNSNADLVDCVAVILGMTREELLRCHTLTPFFHALGELKQTWKPGSSTRHRAAYLRHLPFRTDGQPARLCKHCAEEDMSQGKVSYWRRGHQLPGAYFCDKHEAPLLIAGGAEAFDQCPHHHLESSLPEAPAPSDDTAKAILQRYAHLAAELLGSAPTINSKAASATFGEKAKAIGLRISKFGHRKTLSTHAIESLPMEWLQTAFPRVHWEMGKFISTIDGACMPHGTRYTSATFCLIAALLYNDADQAIIDLVNATVPLRDPLGAEFWGSEEVLDIYCAKNGIVTHVADALGLPQSSVAAGLLNQGLPGLGNSFSALSAASAFYAGRPLDEACLANNADRDAVEALIRANGARFATALSRMQPQNPGA